MGNEVRIHVATKDDVSGPLDKIRDKFDQLGKNEGAKSILQGVGLAAGAAAFNLVKNSVDDVVNVLTESVAKAEENQVAYSRLTAALKANVPAWDGNIEAIQKANEAGAKLGFTDDEMANSLAKLVGATHDIAEAEKIRATAMDLARFKGVSLADATDALTKVDAGSYRILKSLGIQLKDNATQTEALAAVQRVAGGQAEAFSKTTAGAMAKLSATVDEAEEKIGNALLPVLAQVATVIADDIIPAVEGFVSDLDNVNKTLHITDTILPAVGAAWKALTAPLRAAGDALFEIDYGFRKATGGIVTSTDETRHAAIMAGMSLDEYVAAVQKGIDAMNNTVPAGKAADDVISSIGTTAAATTVAVNALATGTAAVGTRLQSSVEAVAQALPKAVARSAKANRKAAFDAALAVVGGLRAGMDAVEQAASELKDRMTHPIALSKRIAKLEGELTGKALAKGLHSTDPLAQEAAKALQKAITDELTALYARADLYGKKTGEAYAHGIESSGNAVAAAAKHIQSLAAAHLRATSPPGPQSPLHDIDKWGQRTIEAYADGMLRGGPKVKAASIAALRGFATIASSTPGGGEMAGGAGPQELHVHVHAGTGIITPGAAQQIAHAIGPVLTKWQQRNQLIPMVGSPQRG